MLSDYPIFDEILVLKKYLLSILLLAACHNDDSGDWKKSLPVDTSRLSATEGDCIYFRDSTGYYITGVVAGMNRSDDGLWYAICFTNYYDSIPPSNPLPDTIRLCGRKVEYHSPQHYTIGLDVIWVQDSIIQKNKKNITGKIDFTILEGLNISAESSAPDYKWLLLHFHADRNIRMLPPDNYYELDKKDFHPDEYFSLTQLREWKDTFYKKPNELLH